jgi:Na+-transporting NADH:ubiquinone oxidoreductase subunit C
MFLITLFFTSIVSAVKLVNDDRIERNEKLKLQRIILRVLDIPVKEKSADRDLVQLFEKRVKSIQVGDKTLYVGYAEDGKTVAGYAFPVGGPGFWGPISGMVAVDPDVSRIIGIAFYKHSETPGLGARIGETWFTNQFEGLRLYPIEGGKKMFYLRPAGAGKNPNELDAVTGATGTSRGVETFLNQELDYFLKEVWKSVKKG